jgi:hypothetical protein
MWVKGLISNLKDRVMSSVENEKFVYFQFNKKLNLPIYIRFIAQNFDPDITGFLRTMKFDELNEKESKDAVERIAKVPGARLLTASEASVMVSRQIAASQESDKWGAESLVQKQGYSVYRYRNVAMIVFSLGTTEWRMGCFSDFGHVDNELAYRIILNRFLSWSLISHGIVGFWGTPVEEGVVIQRSFETKGEVVYIDIKRNNLLSCEGEKKMKHNFTFIKLDNHIKNQSVDLKFERGKPNPIFLYCSSVKLSYKFLTSFIKLALSFVCFGLLLGSVNPFSISKKSF